MGTLYKILSESIFPSNHATGRLGSIEFNMSLIQWFGVPLLGNKKESRKFKSLVILYGTITLSLCTFLYTGFEIHDLVLCRNNLYELTQNFCLSLTHINGVAKVLNVFYWRKDIMRVIEKFKLLTKTHVTSEKQKKTFYWGEFENKMQLVTYACVVGFTGILAMIMAIISSEHIGDKFPYKAKMPDFMPYGVQLVYMTLAVFINAIQIVGIDCLNVALINQTRYQMKILNIAFENLSDNVSSDVSSYFNGLVKHHNAILRIRKDIEIIFRYPILLQFLVSLLIIALAGFQATTVQSDASNAILIYFYCACILIQLFVYCWFGNEVSEQNETLASSGYNSLWYNFDQRSRKSLLTYVMNAQSAFYFTAGGFVRLSLVSFCGIISKSYTYIAVLRQFYAEK